MLSVPQPRFPGMPLPERVRYALEQVRKHWERLLRHEVRDQVGPDVDVEEEIRKFL